MKIAGTMLNNIQQGGIYKLPFPFTDLLSNQKYRLHWPLQPQQGGRCGVCIYHHNATGTVVHNGLS